MEDRKILNSNHRKMSMKHQFIIYADLEFLLKKIALVVKTLKIHQQLKETNIKFLAVHCLHNVPSML